MKDKVLEELLKLDASSLSFQILCHLAFKERSFKPKEVAEELECNPASVRARLSELRSKGLVALGSKGYTSTVRPYDILMKIHGDVRKEMRDAGS